MDVVYLLNFLLTVFFVSMLFWDKKYLKYGLYLILIIGLAWIVFGGCPLVKYQKEKGTPLSDFLKYINPNITSIEIVKINYMILLTFMFIVSWRLIH